MTNPDFKDLSARLKGELHWSETLRRLYATDASAYRELPDAVALPRDADDLKELVSFARKNSIPLIPRTAGTSLAGQVVGKGIIVDVSKYMNIILEINPDESWVRVQPGVIRDDLNRALQDQGLFFPPETSTSNRAMIGGMIGNNSCGANSIVYGSTRDHILELKVLLSDGSEVSFSSLDKAEYENKLGLDSLEGELYRQIQNELSDPGTRDSIQKEYPKASIHRRNTGYAVDDLLRQQPFENEGIPFNLCRFLAGSEGTLAFISEARLRLSPLPPKHNVLVCPHFSSIEDSLKANLVAMQHDPTACELMDHYILDCTKDNKAQEANRFFVEGNPKAILIIELRSDSEADLDTRANALIEDLRSQGLGMHFPILSSRDAPKAWELRKAGLGLLANIRGDAKPVPVVEDTAVDVKDLPMYIAEFNQLMTSHDLYCVHYAHAGAGELHLRPIIDLKTSRGQELFHTVLKDVAELVKKYQGSLSGEHGDGRLRGEFIPFMVGEKNYALLKRIKNTWDPHGIFNPGKITDTPSMNTSMRYERDQKTRSFNTLLDFSKNDGILRAAEQCNGSGDCRKSVLAGGTLCPSYRATRDEKDSTRARANILREILTHSPKENPFNSEEIMEVMDLCLSCKGCKTECPSSVDVTKLKQEFLFQYYKSNPVPKRTRLIADMENQYEKGMKYSSVFNFLLGNPLSSYFIKQYLGFAQSRSLPKVNRMSLFDWLENNPQEIQEPVGSVFLFVDEFTNLMDLQVGIDSVNLLNALGYEVQWIRNQASGRTYLSKGLLSEAKVLAEENLESYLELIDESTPLVGLEPSALLSFRDEYIDLAGDQRMQAQKLSEHCYLLEEFISREFRAGRIKPDLFTNDSEDVLVHGHCFQKAISSTNPLVEMLSIPENYSVQEIPSGCCGMAGSFGYEKEHFEISMSIGEQTLFPALKDTKSIICAPGFSCRHQVKDGIKKTAFHPSKILLKALKKS